jgi:thioredoxin-like negative regulator of GroEL
MNLWTSTATCRSRERFGVKSIPTILVVRGGREVARLDDLVSDRDLTTAFDHEAE